MTDARTDAWVPLVSGPADAPLRLFMFPYAGGNASAWRAWPADLPEWIQFCPVQLPGRGRRLKEAPLRQMHAAIESLREGLRPWLDRPFAFFGHSMGAIMAFEIARALMRARDPLPEAIYVSAASPPHLPDPKPPIHTLPRPEFVARLLEMDGTPPEALADEELLSVYEPLLRADFELAASYVHEPGPLLPVRIEAYGGVDDGEVLAGTLGAWSQHTTGPFAMRLFPGNHFFIEHARSDVLRALSAGLTRVRAETTGDRVAGVL